MSIVCCGYLPDINDSYKFLICIGGVGSDSALWCKVVRVGRRNDLSGAAVESDQFGVVSLLCVHKADFGVS